MKSFATLLSIAIAATSVAATPIEARSDACSGLWAGCNDGTLVVAKIPSLPTCVPYKIKWSGGTPPYDVTLAYEGSPVADYTVHGHSIEWGVTGQPSATNTTTFQWRISDASGLFSQSNQFWVVPGEDQSCVVPVNPF